MKKKLVSILLSAAMVVTMLAGCGQKTAEESAPAGESAGTEAAAEEGAQEAGTDTAEEQAAEAMDPASVTGEFTYWSFTDSANNLVNEFNKVYPNVRIDLQVFGGEEYKTKILTALQSGTDVPDVFDLEEGYMYEFMDSDLLADLSYIGMEELTRDFYDFQVAGMKDSSGNFKSLLFQSSPVGIWYLRDACEKWLGTSDPDEIAAMMTDYESTLALAKEVYEKSNGEVYLWGNMGELIKIEAFSFDPLVQDGKLVISEDWIHLIDEMRDMRNSGYSSELDSWSSEWAAAWNEGKLLFRVMPSWDYFTDWETNAGNVGIAAPYQGSWEGGTGVCVYNNSENKEAAGIFLQYLASDEFQKVNMESYNQVPASETVSEEMAEGFSAADFGGQNLIKTYNEICAKIPGITPDKYTRSTQNLFQKVATNGIKEGKDNDAILEEFKAQLRDQYPEVVIE